jgi:hypothetical protein
MVVSSICEALNVKHKADKGEVPELRATRMLLVAFTRMSAITISSKAESDDTRAIAKFSTEPFQ